MILIDENFQSWTEALSNHSSLLKTKHPLLVDTNVSKEVMSADKTEKVYIQLWRHLFTEKQYKREKRDNVKQG